VLGYAQAPHSPLAGYAPLLGVYGVSLLLVITSCLVVYSWLNRNNKHAIFSFLLILTIWLSGGILKTVSWTEKEGLPFKVSLLQGNISQNLKFDPKHLANTLETYHLLTLQSDARLIVMPETALPMLMEELPLKFRQSLNHHAQQHNGDILIGVFEHEQNRYFNSVVSMGASPVQHYRKNHLVPFGEFIPLRPLLGWLINDILNIPMSDQARGGDRQALLGVAGQRVAVDICYEDVFGEEIIRYLPDATLLVNVTNDAWYGKSHAAMQHNQIAQMRALETGRMMLRATNTGVTSIIDRDGYVLKMLPQHEVGTLNGDAQGYRGSTLYVWWGNHAILAILILMLVSAWFLQKRFLKTRQQ
jgi:apolipoprotein N-acyltransferase